MKNPLELFSELSIFSTFITPSVMWVIVVFIVSVYCLFTAILVFHWRQYGMDNSRIAWAYIIYFSGSAIILLLLFLSAIALI